MKLAPAAIPNPAVAPAISLGAQIGSAAVLIAVVIAIHAAGILATTRLLGLENRNLRGRSIDIRAFGTFVSIGLCLFVLHVLEIALFGGFYLWAGALPKLEPALYFSASVYTTIGASGQHFPDEWRLLSALEGLTGFLMIGWSTAVFVTNMRRALDEEERKGEREAEE